MTVFKTNEGLHTTSNMSYIFMTDYMSINVFISNESSYSKRK